MKQILILQSLLCKILFLNFFLQFKFTNLFVSSDAINLIVIIYKCRRLLFTSIQHKFNCDICCCVEWNSLVFLDAACSPDVVFHSPTEGRDGSSSC